MVLSIPTYHTPYHTIHKNPKPKTEGHTTTYTTDPLAYLRVYHDRDTLKLVTFDTDGDYAFDTVLRFGTITCRQPSDNMLPTECQKVEQANEEASQE